MRAAPITIILLLALAGCGLTEPPQPPAEEEVYYCRPAFYIDPGTGEIINLCEDRSTIPVDIIPD